jgi:hypothetical protein
MKKNMVLSLLLFSPSLSAVYNDTAQAFVRPGLPGF